VDKVVIKFLQGSAVTETVFRGPTIPQCSTLSPVYSSHQSQRS